MFFTCSGLQWCFKWGCRWQDEGGSGKESSRVGFWWGGVVVLPSPLRVERSLRGVNARFACVRGDGCGLSSLQVAAEPEGAEIREGGEQDEDTGGQADAFIGEGEVDGAVRGCV